LLVITYQDFLLSIASSLIASIIFLFLILFGLRPKIKISNIIVLDIDENNEECYRIKFYNTSIFSAYDVNVDLIELEERPAEPFGKHVYYKKIDLTRSNFSVIQHWLPSMMCKNYAHHCTQVKTYSKVRDTLKDNHRSLQLKITLRHGLTGLSKNFIKNYHTDASLIKGAFEFGNSFKVVKKID